ncbi:MAG TPA: manganese efflux pump [Clostridiaceae bacterium]
MGIFYAFLLAFANNLDNIAVRVAYSARGIKIKRDKNLWIAFITFLISFLAATFGGKINFYLGREFTKILSMVLLCLIGLFMSLEPYLKNIIKSDGNMKLYKILKHPEDADEDKSMEIDFGEATILGVALSLNNIGGGISGGLIGVNPVFMGLISAFISFSVLSLGNYAANWFSRINFGNKINTISGVLIILLGIKQLL